MPRTVRIPYKGMNFPINNVPDATSDEDAIRKWRGFLDQNPDAVQSYANQLGLTPADVAALEGQDAAGNFAEGAHEAGSRGTLLQNRFTIGAGQEFTSMWNGLQQFAAERAGNDKKAQALADKDREGRRLFAALDDDGFGMEDIGQLAPDLLMFLLPGSAGIKGVTKATAALGALRSGALTVTDDPDAGGLQNSRAFRGGVGAAASSVLPAALGLRRGGAALGKKAGVKALTALRDRHPRLGVHIPGTQGRFYTALFGGVSKNGTASGTSHVSQQGTNFLLEAETAAQRDIAHAAYTAIDKFWKTTPSAMWRHSKPHMAIKSVTERVAKTTGTSTAKGTAARAGKSASDRVTGQLDEFGQPIIEGATKSVAKGTTSATSSSAREAARAAESAGETITRVPVPAKLIPEAEKVQGALRAVLDKATKKVDIDGRQALTLDIPEAIIQLSKVTSGDIGKALSPTYGKTLKDTITALTRINEANLKFTVQQMANLSNRIASGDGSTKALLAALKAAKAPHVQEKLSRQLWEMLKTPTEWVYAGLLGAGRLKQALPAGRTVAIAGAQGAGAQGAAFSTGHPGESRAALRETIEDVALFLTTPKPEVGKPE